MPAYERRTISGGVPATTIVGSINGSDTSITIADATGWPTGSVGPFGVVINRGGATEEKVLIASRSGTTLTVASGGRGVDGTTGQSHTGETIEHVLFARDLDEPNAHIADTALDHHTQYLDNTRHDIEGRHTFGAAYGTPGAGADIAAAAATGTGDNPAREDHVHKIPAGLLTAAMQNAEAWTAWSPTYTNVTVGNGTVVARSMKRGRDVTLRFSLVFGSSTAFSGTIAVDLPYAASGSGYQSGTAFAIDSDSSNYYSGSAFVAPSGTTFGVILGFPTRVNATAPITWAEGDVLSVELSYEAAA